MLHNSPEKTEPLLSNELVVVWKGFTNEKHLLFDTFIIAQQASNYQGLLPGFCVKKQNKAKKFKKYLQNLLTKHKKTVMCVAER